MEKLECCVNFNRLKRKEFLEPLALTRGINPKKYKNKRLLADAILYSKYENKTDPITLESIVLIPKERLITWEQDNKHYAADVESMFHYIQYDDTNPWAIDKASGFDKANNVELYIERFSMKLIPGFYKEIIEKYNSLKFKKMKDADPLPDRILLRQNIDMCGEDLYITHITDFIEHQTDPLITVAILHDSVLSVIQQFVLQLNIVEDKELSLEKLSILDQLYHGLKVKLISQDVSASSLQLASDFFIQCRFVLDPTMIERIFDSIDINIKELRIV